MNYDTQYAFSHGLASTPHFQTLPQQQQHLQQRHQFQQQQVFPQQQYGQIAPTSNVFFQFTAGGNPIFQQKDVSQMAALATGGIQQTPLATQHGMVTSPFVKQGVPVRMEGNCVHLVGGAEGMIYQPQPQQSDLKIITASPDTRMLQQHHQLDTGLGLPQNTATILGLDMIGGQAQPLLDQSSLDIGNRHQPQQQAISMPGQGGLLSYNKQQPFSGPWLQPQQHVSSSTGNLQHQQQQTQSALPSFTHLWSQFQQQKNQTSLAIQQPQQQAHMSTIQQSQQFQNQTQLQPSHFAAASNFSALTSMPMINMSQFQDQSQQSPLPILPNQVACFSPCGPNSTPSPCSVDRHVSGPDGVRPNSSLAIKVKGSSCQSTLSATDDSLQHSSPTLLTDSTSVPPKVTVILDSLPHCETFPPTTHFQGNSETALKLGASSVIPCTDSPTTRNKHRNAAPTSNGQLNLHQKKLGLSRPLKSISSTGSSMERSSSESSNFSSPPYAITPPNSNDSLFSPGIQVFHPDEHMLSDSLLEETPSSLCLSSTSLLPAMSPSSISSSPLQNPSAQPKTTEKNFNVKLDGGKVNQPFPTQGNATTLTSVATVLALSSPSTTTVITAMASSHQLVTTTTATTSVTLASQCLIDGSATAVRAGCITSNHPNALCKPTKMVDTSNLYQTKPMSSPMSSTGSCEKKKVKVPFSWHRKQLDNGLIVYLSPSGTVLESYEQICQYLLSDSTCKCGLECPIQVEEFFSFDPSFESQPWTSEIEGRNTKDTERVDSGGKQKEDLRKLCTHRRQVLALAALHSSQSHMATGENSLLAGKKRDRKKSVGGGENLILSPLKRLKTSITNAVNRHAVTSGKKRPIKNAPDALDSLGGLNKESNLSLAVPSVTSQNSPSSEETLAGTSVGVGNNKFSSFLGGYEEWQEIYSPHDSSLNHAEHRSAQLNDTNVCELRDNSTGHGNFESPKKYRSNQDQQRSQISPLDTALPQTQNLSSDMDLSNAIGPETVGTPLPTSPAIWDSSSTQQVAPKHSTPIGNKSDLQILPESLKHSEQSSSSTGSPKNKAKRPKSKRERQKQLFTPSSTPCTKQASSKITLEDDLPLPSSTVSFLENPTVFVAQQTVMINNSMASCKMAYSSPGPTVPSPGPTDTIIKSEEQEKSSGRQDQGAGLKEYKGERKEAASTDSNKSFSDATENNDSAYLSQTGSDQERSDTIDGSDTNLDGHKISDVYDFNCSEDHKAESGIVHVNMKSSDGDISKGSNSQKFPKPSQADSEISSSTTPSAIDKGQQEKPSAAKSKPKQRSSPQYNKKVFHALKNGLEDPSKNESIGSLNKDLSDLLASDNWNIPAVQQVLAQYSGGDPGQLNAAIQQVLSQASTAGLVFPASNLLTAAAQAQVRGGSSSKKAPLNGVVPPGDPRSALNKQQQQKESAVPQPPDHIVKNEPHRSQQSSRDKGVNVVKPVIKQEPQQSNPGPLKAVKPKSKNGAAIANPHSNPNRNVQVSACQQPVEVSPKLGLSMSSAVPKSSAQVSSGSNPVILNGFGTPRMVMNPQSAAPVSGVTTLVSKSTTSVGIGLNPTVLGTVSTPTPQLAQPHLLATDPQQQQQSVGNACIINATNHQLGKPAGTAGQPTTLPAANTQQLLAPSGHQPTQLATPQTANAQIMNALSVQGLNPSQQLLLQQMSPCNPVSQLSPAMAAQLLSQNQQQQQQLPQVSPSFLPGGHPQIQKLPQNSLLGTQTGIFASVPLPSFSATSATSNCSGLFTQANTCIPPAQSQQRPAEASLPAILNASVECTDQLTHGLPQVKDVATAVSLANASMFAAAATSQPVFVIPQANASPVVQVLGSTQSLTTATDLNVQQQNNSLAAQLFGQHQSQQTAPFDTSQLQNLLSGGFNPLALQQTINTLNLSGVHQQQQQLQMLQLQQLMLQQFQNQQNPGLQGISIPGPQAAPQAIVNAVMPTQNLQLSSMVDMNAIHPSLSPVAAAATHQNLLGNTLSQTQLHITSSIGAQPVVQGSAPATVSVVQNAGLQKMQQSVVKTIPSGPPLIQAPAVTTAAGKQPVNTIVASHQDIFHQKQLPVGRAQSLAPPTNTTKSQVASVSPAPSSTLTPASPASSSSKSPSSSSKPSKSKSKSKKSENKKVSDPESERNEEDIAATVQQILAQAVQQQRELQLAAKNQPPPPPKSKSKKSQARSKANTNHLAVGAALAPVLPAAATKEHDLGKLPSIMSDDVVIHKPEQAVLSSSNGLAASTSTVGKSSLVQPLLPSTTSCDSSLGAPPDAIRPAHLEQQQLMPAKLQSTFMSPHSLIPPPPPPPPIVSMAAARSAQSSQPVGTEPLVTSPVPPKQYNLMYQGALMSGKASPQVLHKNGAVESESSVQPNVSPSGMGIEQSASNKNLPMNPGPNLASSCSNKKSTISLKDHLSSIISKDKDSSKKKVNGGSSSSRPGRTKDAEELSKAAHVVSLSQQNTLKLEPVGPKGLRKSVK